MARTALESRLSRLDAARPAAKIPPWCGEKRKLDHIFACVRGDEWTCPDLTPKKAIWKNEKMTWYEEYFAELDGQQLRDVGNEST